MQSSEHDIAHLAGLIEAARSEAERLGPDLAAAAADLVQALAKVRSIAGHGGRPDEGVSPSELTTENDR